jgi:hypothetical protein
MILGRADGYGGCGEQKVKPYQQNGQSGGPSDMVTGSPPASPRAAQLTALRSAKPSIRVQVLMERNQP